MLNEEQLDFEQFSDGELTQIMRDEANYSEQTRHLAFMELAKRSDQDLRDGG